LIGVLPDHDELDWTVHTDKRVYLKVKTIKFENLLKYNLEFVIHDVLVSIPLLLVFS